MQWWEILLLVAALMLVILTIFLGLKRIRYQGIIERVKESFKQAGIEGEVSTFHPDDLYQIKLVNERTYLFKIIDMNPRYEVIITNAEKVVINDDIKNWRRATKPRFVSGIKAFIRESKQDLTVVKIVLIYPGCHNITKYINESDCYLVDSGQKIDDLHYLRFQDLKDFMKKH